MSEKRFLDKTGVEILWNAIKEHFRTKTSIVPVECGGTGASDKEGARTALEITPENIGAVPTTRAINDKPLNSDITLNANDIGAASVLTGETIP